MAGFKGRAGLCLASIASLVALAAPASAAAFGPISSFGSDGSGTGQLHSVGSLGIAPDSSVYVADYGNSRIAVFTPAGEFEFAFGREVDSSGGDVCTVSTGCKVGTQGAAAGELNHAESLAFDSAGNVYVADSFNERVDVFSPEGEFLYAFGKEVNETDHSDVCTTASGCVVGVADGSAGALHTPKGIGIEGGRAYVPENDGARVSVFSIGGEFLYAFGDEVNPSDNSDICTALSECRAGKEVEAAGGVSGPYDVKPLPTGQLVISDTGNRRIDVFTTGGAFVRAFGKEVNLSDNSDVCAAASGCRGGESDGSAASLGEPNPVTVDPAGNVYVGDTTYERVDEFDQAGEFVRAFGAGVLDGADAFQSCVPGTGCMAGHDALVSGATPHPFGVAADCRGTVYVAEAGGLFTRVERFGEPGTPPAPCPPAPAAPTIAATASTPIAPAPSNRFAFGKLKLSPRKGIATLFVVTPGAGSVSLAGKGILRVRRAAGKAASVKLPVRLAGRAQKTLLKTGLSKVTARVTFTPTGGDPLTHSRKLTLKALLPR